MVKWLRQKTRGWEVVGLSPSRLCILDGCYVECFTQHNRPATLEWRVTQSIVRKMGDGSFQKMPFWMGIEPRRYVPSPHLLNPCGFSSCWPNYQYNNSKFTNLNLSCQGRSRQPRDHRLPMPGTPTTSVVAVIDLSHRPRPDLRKQGCIALIFNFSLTCPPPPGPVYNQSLSTPHLFNPCKFQFLSIKTWKNHESKLVNLNRSCRCRCRQPCDPRLAMPPELLLLP